MSAALSVLFVAALAAVVAWFAHLMARPGHAEQADGRASDGAVNHGRGWDAAAPARRTTTVVAPNKQHSA